MSFDLIKKQKEELQKEKRKVTQSADFSRHPLAYQPKAKGRELALKERIIKTKGKLDSVVLENEQKNNKLETAGITPDKNSAALFFSNMQAFNAGKKGNHIADVFSPNNQLPFERQKSSEKPKLSFADFQRESYKGYNESEARLKIKLGKEHTESGDAKNPSSLPDVLMDTDSDFPKYDPKDINEGLFAFGNGGQEKNKARHSKKPSKKDQDFWEEVFLEQQERIKLKEKALKEEWEDKKPNYDTSVKLSFAKPNTRLVLAVEEEEEEISNSPNYLISNKSQIPNPKNENLNSDFNDYGDSRIQDEYFYEKDTEPRYQQDKSLEETEGNIPEISTVQNNNHSQNINVVDLTKVSRGNGYSGKAGVKIPIIEKSRPLQKEVLLSDYTPQTDYQWDDDGHENSGKINFPVQEIKNKISGLLGLKKKLFPETNKIVDFEFKNGREYQNDKKSWKNSNDEYSQEESYKVYPHDQILPLVVARDEDPNTNKTAFAELRRVEEEEESFVPFNDLNLRPDHHVFLGEKKEGRIKKLARKFITKREKRALQKSIKIVKKPVEKFQRNFFTFRSPNSKRSFAVLTIAVTMALTVPLGVYVQKIIEAKSKVEEQSNKALQEVDNAKSAIASAKPEEARHNFQTAYQDFLSADESLDQVGGVMLTLIKVIPGGDKVESGRKILESGKHLTMAGQIMSEAFGLFLGEESSLRKNLTATDNLSSLKELTTFSPEAKSSQAKTLTEAIVIFKDKLDKAKNELSQANDLLGGVDEKAVPQDKQEQLVKLKEQLPLILENINHFEGYTDFLLNLLGHNQSKTYLFLFENNDEIRATGGFIGTYGIIKVSEGEISQLFIDGIYNPDGQLKERIIPPKPIQKMSATWSMHDANWWPDFPKSAQKVAWFYEKTGGPTVDGVIALTPKLMKDLLTVTGPITMDKYNTTVTADNFIEVTQYKVEVDYDKQMNRPKQFLADLLPIVLGKVFNATPDKWVQILKDFSDCLNQRQILMYFFDKDSEQKISELGWSGEVLDTPKDYLSVINTNISGLKTDHVINQTINHSVEIKPDGSIFDTVSVTRTHNGGKEKYDWYNGVNSDWMRIYVPKGSQLLSAEGYTREVDSSPVDYEKLGFVKDEMVSSEEDSTTIDPYSGTRIYEDSGKTVFANWTYVSPGETLTVKYTYLLPFKLRFDDIKKPADTYSLLVQKQAGDEHSKISSEVKGLDNFDIIYSYPKTLPLPSWNIAQDLNGDLFAGAVLTEKGKGGEVSK